MSVVITVFRSVSFRFVSKNDTNIIFKCSQYKYMRLVKLLNLVRLVLVR